MDKLVITNAQKCKYVNKAVHKKFCLQIWLKKFLSLKWAEKNILLALSALKNIVFVEKK